VRAALLVTLIAGCAYKPGSFNHRLQDFPGQRTTVGCVDLAVERRPDLSSGGTVLAYEFGNRCDHPATIDLANAHVIAQLDTGERVEMHPWDPELEIQALKLDGRVSGAEALAYPANNRIEQICVDAASITHETQAQWLCFSSTAPADTVAEVGP
jgi:hypothetical protein